MSGPYVLGLTGSIGMGKSTTAAMFAEAGIPVWDADAAVHRLYTEDFQVIEAIRTIVPRAVPEHEVNRVLLSMAIEDDQRILSHVEAIVHPRVAQDREDFKAKHKDAKLIVFDIPLIYETFSQAGFDGILVVSVDPQTQRERVLAREGMTEDKFEMILSKQLPDADKRELADFVIETESVSQTWRDVLKLIETLTGEPQDA